MIPSMIGPWMAGRILDTLDPRWVWYAGGILLVVAILAFLQLHLTANQRIEALTTPVAQGSTPGL
jgi:hypothetical protein